jgi:hypothetical protein
VTNAQLSRLFDFQRFAGNARLQKIIDDTHRRVEARELTDDELDQVAAAGAPDAAKPKKAGDLPI